MEENMYKKALGNELQEITSALETIAQYDERTGDWRPVPAEPADDADQNEAADTAEESIERQAEVANLETRYRNIVRAIEKIQNGTYGICEISGATIEPERLEANPAARTCIAERDRESELPL